MNFELPDMTSKILLQVNLDHYLMLLFRWTEFACWFLPLKGLSIFVSVSSVINA